MSFRDAMNRFARQAAAARADAFSGVRDGSGKNLQIGSVKFCAAFAQIRTGRAVTDQGDDIQADAVALVPDSAGVDLAINTEVLHLVSGERYTVVQIPRHPVAAETKVVLRRHNDA